jgi:integrase
MSNLNQNLGRRGMREGSITHLGVRGLWMARIQLGGRRRAFYAKTRAQAERKMQDAKRAYERGIDVSGSGMTVDEFSATWLKNSQSMWQPATLEHHAYLLRIHIIPAVGRRRLGKLAPAVVQRFYTDMLEAGHSPSLVRHAHRVLRSCLQRAVKLGYIERNPCDLVDLPKHQQKEKPRVSADEVRRLLKSAREDRLDALFTLGLSTGCRISELLGLRWDRVDLDTNTIHITDQLKKGPDGYYLGSLKTARSRRYIEIGPTTVAALKSHKARMAEEQLRLGPAWANDLGLVFISEFGTPLSRDNIRNRNWRSIVERSGIGKHLTLHNMRDIFASLALGNGMNVVTVSAMLGHRDPSVTLQRYSYALPDSGREVANIMDGVIAAAG